MPAVTESPDSLPASADCCHTVANRMPVFEDAMQSNGRRQFATLSAMSQQLSPDAQLSGDGGAPDLRGSAQELRGSSERLAEVVMSESTGTVGLIFIEQKEGIVVLMCVGALPRTNTVF
jgi:hypothetical protein